MKKKVLFMGYGNMTKKYCAIIKKLKTPRITIKHYTSQNIPNNLYKKIKKLKEYNPDIIFICSSTSDHYKHLSLVNKIFKDKLIMVEKPLFHKFIKFKQNNKIYVGYNLRHDPLMQYLKNKIKEQKIWSAEVFCNTYLPNWRKRDYTKTYSAKKNLGGGVLLDLSHELDYINWIFGELKIKFAVNNKISNLKINTDDNLLILGKAKNVKQFIIHLNYYSKIESRYILINGDKINFKADLLNKKITFVKKNKEYIKSWNDKKWQLKTFENMIKSMINNKNIKLPNLKNSLKVLKTVEKIKKFRS